MAELSTSSLAGRYRLGESEEWRDLLTHLDFNDGFSLVVLLAPDSYGVEICRAELEKHLAKKERRLHIHRIALDEPPEELPRRLRQRLPKNIDAVWVEVAPPEVEGRVAEAGETFDGPEQRAFCKALRALNPERNLLQENMTVPLLIAGPVWLQNVFREAAPDLWSIRSTVINIHPHLDGIREEFGELEMTHALSFQAPDKATVERAAQLRRDIQRIKDKPGAELLHAELLRGLGVELTNLLQWQEAERVLTAAYRLCDDFHAPAEDQALVARDLGRVLKMSGQWDRARHYFEVTLQLEEAAFGREHGRYARACSDLGIVCSKIGDYPRAEILLREALKIRDEIDGENWLSADLSNLAQLLQATNRLAEAEPLMRRALEIDEKRYGSEHSNVSTDLNNLAQLLQTTNRLAEAEPLMRRALEIDEKGYGPEHPNVAVRLSNLAQLLQDTNRLSEAEPLMRRVLAIDEKCYGGDHSEVAVDLNNLALLLQATNRLVEAEPLMRRALKIEEKSYGSEHLEVAISLNNLALLLQQTNRLSEAEPLMRRALGIYVGAQKRSGHEFPQVRRMTENYAHLLGLMDWEADQIAVHIEKVMQEVRERVGRGD